MDHRDTARPYEDTDVIKNIQRKMTADELAGNIYYNVAWDEIHGFHEAAVSDCPHKEIMDFVFDTRRLTKSSIAAMSQRKDLETFLRAAVNVNPKLVLEVEQEQEKDGSDRIGELCRIALRVYEAARAAKIDEQSRWSRCHGPLIQEAAGASNDLRLWSMPNVEIPLSEENADLWVVQDVMRVEDIKAGAAIRVPVPVDVTRTFLDRVTDASAYASEELTQKMLPTIPNAFAVQKDSDVLEFFSTVLTSKSDITDVGFSFDAHVYLLHRFSHLATMTLLRQLASLGVNLPVFGVLLSRSTVSVHIDWASEINGCMEADSALYTPDEEETDVKQWELCTPADALEIVFILDNLRHYAATTFASGVVAGLASAPARILQGEYRPWKWNRDLLIDHVEEEGSDEQTALDSDACWRDGQGRSDPPPDAGVMLPAAVPSVAAECVADVGGTSAGDHAAHPTLPLDEKHILPSPPYTPGDAVQPATAE